MGLGLEGYHTLDVFHLEIVGGGLVLGGKLLHHRTLGKGHVVLVGREYLAGILLCGFLDHGKEARFHLFAVDDKGAAENLMTAVLGVDLGKSEDFGVGERPPVLLLYLVQILYLFGREGESFLLVVLLQVVHILDRLRLVVHGEDILIQPLVHALQHGVVVRLFTAYGEILLDTRNAAKTHVLGNLNGIGAPRCNHLAAGTHIKSLQSVNTQAGGIAVKPTKFVDFLLIGLMVNLSRNHVLIQSLEKKNHSSLYFYYYV